MWKTHGKSAPDWVGLKHQQFQFLLFFLGGEPFLQACRVRVKGNQSALRIIRVIEKHIAVLAKFEVLLCFRECVSRHIPYTNTVCRYDKFVS